MRSHIQLTAAKNYFLGFATSGAVLLSGLYYFNSKNSAKEQAPVENTVEYIAAELPPLQDFNPNEMTAGQWQSLGFSERQVATILKYKQVLGGRFKSKEQLKKCYAISEEKFAQIEPFILLPETSRATNQRFSNYSPRYTSYPPKNERSERLQIFGKFNPDQLSAADFVQMGFTEKQANSILKYKNYLGGSFISKEKFKACFMISDEKYHQMEPYLLLPESAPEDPVTNYSNKPKQKPQIAYQKFDPNTTDLAGWRSMGFSEKQAQVIVNYRDRNLKGSFKSLDDIERCFVISPEKFQELKPFIVLTPESAESRGQPKTSFASKNVSNDKPAEAKSDFSKIDLNQITFRQLQEFGFDDKSAAMMLSFRKKLGGFVNKQQIVDTYDIDKDLAQKLIYIAPLDASKVTKYSLTDAPEEWLKNHPYFKYSADKIIYYRITNPNDRKIWKYLKLKPEYETRMRMYIKND